MASPATIDRKWYVVDAEGMTLGRLASEVAKVCCIGPGGDLSFFKGKSECVYTKDL